MSPVRPCPDGARAFKPGGRALTMIGPDGAARDSANGFRNGEQAAGQGTELSRLAQFDGVLPPVAAVISDQLTREVQIQRGAQRSGKSQSWTAAAEHLFMSWALSVRRPRSGFLWRQLMTVLAAVG